MLALMYRACRRLSALFANWMVAAKPLNYTEYLSCCHSSDNSIGWREWRRKGYRMTAIKHSMKSNRGFTLIELMIALTVLGIAVSIAVPSYAFLITTNRMASEINDFVANLNYARSEAVKRGLSVSLCRSNDTPATCNTPTPAGGWEGGWIVVVSDGTVLKDYAALNSNDRLIGKNNVLNTIRFDRNGFASGSNGTVTLCDPDNNLLNARAVVIARTGRIRLAQDTNSDGIVNGPSGNVTCS